MCTADSAYVADSSKPEDRSRFFSLNIGIYSIGIAVGPTLGGYIVSATNDLLSVHYFITLTNLAAALFYWFIIPESLPLSAREEAKLKAKTQSDKQNALDTVKSTLETLTMFLPKKIDVPIPDDEENSGIMRRSRSSMSLRVRSVTDWNMFWFASCTFMTSLALVSL